MSLQRKENNLRKAQAKYDKITNPPRWRVIKRLGNTEFQVEFVREQNQNGKFKTKANIVRGTKEYHGNNRGIVHKAVNLKYRVKGDTPSITRFINDTKPTTKKGKALKLTAKATNFLVHDVAQTAVDVSLGAETIGLKAKDFAMREGKNKLKQKYTREAVDDFHRGTLSTLRIGTDAVKGTRNHFKQKKQHKLEKAKFKLQKADNKVFKEKNYSPKLKTNKADRKTAKAKFKSQKSSRNFKYHKAKNYRLKQVYKQEKRELKFDKKQLKKENKFRVKKQRNLRRIKRNSNPGLLILKPAKYTAKRLKSSSWQKAVNEDPNNDVMKVVDSAKRRIVDPAAQKASKPNRLHKQEKKRDKLANKEAKSNQKLNKQKNKLNEKRNDTKKKKKKKKNSKKSVSERAKEIFKTVKTAVNAYVKEAIRFLLAALVPILIILLIFFFLLMVLSSIFSGGSFVLGTYTAQDYDLSEAEKYYTQLAYEMNEKILKVSSSDDWKDGLADFGAKKKDLKDEPDNWYFGKSSVYDWEPVYDFDCYKLWSFLCAYYYDFDEVKR